MLHIILSSIVLSIVHALIPNHWLPIVAISRAEKWSRATTLWATAISGIAHIASTIAIGILVGLAGLRLSETYEWISTVAAPSILIGLGIFYIAHNYFSHHHHHDHFGKIPRNKSIAAIIVSLSVGMFFSPCIELESYYFTAGTFGWGGILMVSLVYLVITVSAMLVLVAVALKGMNRFKFEWFEKNEKAVIGLALILIGILTFFVH
jgi:nickel/cobalt transporter (NicO) family protein